MKRGVLVTMVVIWALVAIAAIVFIVAYWNGGNLGLFDIEIGAGFDVSLLKQESSPADGVGSLEVLTTYDGIELVAGGGNEFRVTQYGRDNAPEEELFRIERSGDKLTISTKRNNRIRVGVFFFGGAEEKLVIEAPRDWSGNVSLEASSGSVRLNDEFRLENVSMSTTSGSIRLAKSVSAASMRIKSSSGSVKLENGASVSGDFESGSTSGTQTVDGLLAAGGNVRMDSSSGSIRVRNGISSGGGIYVGATSGSVTVDSELTANTLEAESSSGTIRLGRSNVSDSFDISCTSGSVHVEGISGRGRLKSSSGSVTAVLMQPVGNVDISSTSGSVRLTVPRDLSFDFEADTTSGSIKTDFEVLYRSNRKNSAVGKVGNNPTALIRAEASSGSIRVELR